MIPKKNPNKDLEKRKLLFFEIGLVLALVITFISFQWTVQVKEVETTSGLRELEFEEEMIPVTRQEPIQEKATLPPALKPLDVITIVDDSEEIEQEIDLVDVEANQEMEVDIVAPQEIEVEEEEVDETQIFVIVEEMPIFRPDICKTSKEGEIELYRYIQSQIRYPAIAQENGITGRVYVRFVVDSDGGVTDIKVVRGVDPSLDREAVRVIKNLPPFAPGKQRGRPVKVAYTSVIKFEIQ